MLEIVLEHSSHKIFQETFTRIINGEHGETCLAIHTQASRSGRYISQTEFKIIESREVEISIMAAPLHACVSQSLQCKAINKLSESCTVKTLSPRTRGPKQKLFEATARKLFPSVSSKH